MKKASSSREDYLEAMVMLGATTENSIRSVDIAAKMNVAKPSVTKAVSELREMGLVNQEAYGQVTLTEEGEKLGNAVLDRHNMLTKFLHKGLGIDLETAEEEACQMEHSISDDSFEKWESFISKIGL